MIEENKTLNNFTFLYLYIPTIMFLFGWCRYIISIPLSILLRMLFLRKILYRILIKIKNKYLLCL